MKLNGRIAQVKPFGVAVDIEGSKESGFCHVSQVSSEFIRVRRMLFECMN